MIQEVVRPPAVGEGLGQYLSRPFFILLFVISCLRVKSELNGTSNSIVSFVISAFLFLLRLARFRFLFPVLILIWVLYPLIVAVAVGRRAHCPTTTCNIRVLVPIKLSVLVNSCSLRQLQGAFCRTTLAEQQLPLRPAHS